MSFATAPAIFLGAFLLFLVQPLTARRLLPSFGGSPAVWIVSLLFFQSVLLAGYLYAHGLSRLGRRWQRAVHAALLLASLALIPIGPKAPSETPSGEPAAAILWMLGSSLGLPLLLLSSTNPLLQSWAAEREKDRVYRLFALSNAGSLIGLWCYPFLLEPFTSLGTQVSVWSAAFVLFVAFDAVAAVSSVRAAPSEESVRRATEPARVTRSAGTTWLALSATGSILLMATSNQLTRNVAAVPFLWVLPLSLYLLSFVIAFERDRWYVRILWAGLFLASLGGVLVLLSLEDEPDLVLQLVVYSVNLLSGCMICHGELRERRPPAAALTRFYLFIAFGGALGGIFVGLIAPKVFSGYWEYPLGLALVYLVGGASLLRSKESRSWSLFAAGGAAVALLLGSYVVSETSGAIWMRRSFFGVLRIYERHVGTRFWQRDLWNGPVAHGAQLLAPGRRREPILYYSPDTGIGLALFHEGMLERAGGGRRIGVVGLGTGSLAAYGHRGDVHRFYELNPDVVEAANEHFFYLAETEAAVEVVIGDARLSLARELREQGPQRFDLLVLDAFTGDAIPMHLLTREAFALYDSHLSPEGTIAVHVSNLHFNLRPVVRSHAESLGAVAVLVETNADPEKNLYVSDWVLVTRNAELIASPSLQQRMTPWRADVPYRAEDFAWTDDYANFFRVLK